MPFETANHSPASAPVEKNLNPPKERRRELRYPCHDPAEIRWLCGNGVTLCGRILDISKSGLRVEVRMHLSPGSQVEVVLPKQVVVFGEVRHCRRMGDDFHAGILIEDVFYAKDVHSTHLHDHQLALYLAGHGLTAREVFAISQHARECQVCGTRLAAKSLSEAIGRGRVAKG